MSDGSQEEIDKQIQDAFNASDSALNLLSQQYDQLSEQIKILLEDSETRVEDFLHFYENKTQILYSLDELEKIKNENKSQVKVFQQKYQDLESQLNRYLESIKNGEIFIPDQSSTVNMQQVEQLRKLLQAGIDQVQQKLKSVETISEGGVDVEKAKDIVADLQSINKQLQVVGQQLVTAATAIPLTNQQIQQQEDRKITAELTEEDGKVRLDFAVNTDQNSLQIITPENIPVKLDEAQKQLEIIQKDVSYLSSNLVGEYNAAQLDVSQIQTDIIKKIAGIIQQLIQHNQELENNNRDLNGVKEILNSKLGDLLDSDEREKVVSGVNKLIEILEEQSKNLDGLILQIDHRNQNITELYSQLNTLDIQNEELVGQLQDSKNQLSQIQQMYVMKVNDCEQLQQINKKLESTCQEWTSKGRKLMVND
eukprot:TRINITY_DN9425_c1_g1_i2.p1 TRINITY_DN9425_c1_g1~~TRINITY_DN9425_c1_g1_i2.p1  ORF type:complete len:433 (-),score=80.94 TRINITY_DN9425_c1_g1_i2:141-1409(-)